MEFPFTERGDAGSYALLRAGRFDSFGAVWIGRQVEGKLDNFDFL